jgi:hypothetical protein
MNPTPRGSRSREPDRGSSTTMLLSEADRLSRRRRIEFRGAVGSVLLCAGLTILPMLMALDAAVWLGCRGLDRIACLTLIATALTAAELAQGGVADQASTRSSAMAR